MYELFIHFNNVKVYQFNNLPLGKEIKERIIQINNNLLYNSFYLQMDGKIINENDRININSSMIIRVIIRLLGGKGGYGAMLKSLAKRSGNKKTTDFSACRDLSGRRLRHVNDEIILQKWKEAKENGEEFDPEQDTKTGIDMWFLNAPSWVDGFKGNARKRYMRPRRKTRLCIDWMSARQGVDPPKNSPPWWGCPRGERCEFAHGEEELKGKGKEVYTEQEKQEEYLIEKKKRDAYVGVLDQSASDETIYQLVEDGMRAAKRVRLVETQNNKIKYENENEVEIDIGIENIEEKQKNNLLLDITSISTEIITPSTTATSIITTTSTSPTLVNDNNITEFVSTESLSLDWLETLSGDVITHVDGLIECNEGFGTIYVKNCSIGPTSQLVSQSSNLNSHYRYYYEVELVTAGLFQIGWKDKFFTIISSDENGDNGIGDDYHSWGYDGFRQKLWNGQSILDNNNNSNSNSNNNNTTNQNDNSDNNNDNDNIQKNETFNNSIHWNVGDIIGCECDILINSTNLTNQTNQTKLSSFITIKLSYYHNGNLLGVAFDSQSNISLKSLLDSVKDGNTEITPAITLEQGESLVINVGQRAFKYQPKSEINNHLNEEEKNVEETKENIIYQSIYDIIQTNKNNSKFEDVSVLRELELIEELKTYNQKFKEYENELKLSNQSNETKNEVVSIHLESNEYQSANDLLQFGLEGLKNELIRRGLKSGGTLQERADRLWSVRGLKEKKIDKKLKAKK